MHGMPFHVHADRYSYTVSSKCVLILQAKVRHACDAIALIAAPLSMDLAVQLKSLFDKLSCGLVGPELNKHHEAVQRARELVMEMIKVIEDNNADIRPGELLDRSREVSRATPGLHGPLVIHGPAGRQHCMTNVHISTSVMTRRTLTSLTPVIIGHAAQGPRNHRREYSRTPRRGVAPTHAIKGGVRFNKAWWACLFQYVENSSTHGRTMIATARHIPRCVLKEGIAE